MSSLIFAIDPGTNQSGWVIFDTVFNRPQKWGIDPNPEVRDLVREMARNVDDLAFACEMIHLQGMPAGREVFETCVWIGRFLEAADPVIFERYTRHSIKIHICGSDRAKDKNVRQALIDLFGGDSVAIGGVKCKSCSGKGWKGRGRPVCPDCRGTKWEQPPGPLKGISSHVWSALAVAITHRDCNPPF